MFVKYIHKKLINNLVLLKYKTKPRIKTGFILVRQGGIEPPTN